MVDREGYSLRVRTGLLPPFYNVCWPSTYPIKAPRWLWGLNIIPPALRFEVHMPGSKKPQQPDWLGYVLVLLVLCLSSGGAVVASQEAKSSIPTRPYDCPSQDITCLGGTRVSNVPVVLPLIYSYSLRSS